MRQVIQASALLRALSHFQGALATDFDSQYEVINDADLGIPQADYDAVPAFASAEVEVKLDFNCDGVCDPNVKGRCRFICPVAQPGIYANHGDCSASCACSGNTQSKRFNWFRKCPPGTSFDGQTNRCTVRAFETCIAKNPRALHKLPRSPKYQCQTPCMNPYSGVARVHNACTFQCGMEAGVYHDPESCEKTYTCSGKARRVNSYFHHCPEGESWDGSACAAAAFRTCEREKNLWNTHKSYDCMTPCSAKQSICPVGKKCPESCRFKCTEEAGYYFDENDCTKTYYCSGNKGVKKGNWFYQCPEGTTYDYRTKGCTAQAFQVCTDIARGDFGSDVWDGYKSNNDDDTCWLYMGSENVQNFDQAGSFEACKAQCSPHKAGYFNDGNRCKCIESGPTLYFWDAEVHNVDQGQCNVNTVNLVTYCYAPQLLFDQFCFEADTSTLNSQYVYKKSP